MTVDMPQLMYCMFMSALAFVRNLHIRDPLAAENHPCNNKIIKSRHQIFGSAIWVIS